MANQRRLWSPDTCAGDTTQPVDRVAVSTPAASTDSGFDPTAYIGQGNRYNCSDFKSQADAQAVLRADPRDPNKLDSNGDGIACESNPPPSDRVPVQRS